MLEITKTGRFQVLGVVTTSWSQNEREFPNWALACQKVNLLIQPSCAAPKQFFHL